MVPASKLPKKFSRRLGKKNRYCMVTAYDAPTAGILADAKVDFILVGDSLGMVVLGLPNTAMVTMEQMIHHAKAVRRGAPKNFIIADLPKKGVLRGPDQALHSSQRFRDEAGVDAVKIEWGRHCLRSTELLVKNKITVQGHVGLTPQAVKHAKDFKVRGRTAVEADQVLRQAKAFENAGASLLLVECVPWQVTGRISASVRIPVIGIGAGPDCDGQVLVFHDLVGLYEKFHPRFVKRYMNAAASMREAVERYADEVRSGKFPGHTHSFSMSKDELGVFLT